MVDIDERVVSMKFNSSDFEKKSKSTLNTLDQLNEKLTFKDAANNTSLNAITDNVQKIADKAYTIVDRMIDKIKDNIANKLVNFLQQNTVGQLQAGWSKYADMTTSVATLKSQGYAMERITDQLERLNYFTDETSYNFTAMVGEIGKFTASGQSLEDATTAMMGIANWAALSGKNASEASRAMYQLSQALGAGQMRLQDYKSVQNLNMDTKEFRENAIEAALAVGTLKDNLDGTYTSVLNNKITFSLQNFAESLTQGKWFNSNVMMTVYKKYSEAVDEIRAIYEEGSYMDAQGNYVSLNTTAEAVSEVKKNNEYLISKFQKTQLNDDQINKLLSKWKKVEKVTDMTVKEYAEMNNLTEEQAKIQMEAQQKGYAEYLKEYAETFQNAEKSAVDALEDWHTYVSSYGIKAFSAAQEAKTFTEAIESAKDAASTVWTTIYTNVFGNYEEAKSLWTDLANSLYEIFVNRLWDLNDVFEYWRTGGASALESLLDKYQKELKSLESKSSPVQAEIDRMKLLRQEIKRLDTEINTIFLNGEKTTTYAVQDQIAKYEDELNAITAKTNLTEADKTRIKALEKELGTLNEALENTIFVDGRTRMFQGLYAFGAGFKSLLFNLRDGWDQVTEDNIGGKRLLSFSEKLRNDGLKFYKLMSDLGNTSFFRNISQGIKNLLSPINGLIQVVGSAIGQFLPRSKTVQDVLNEISTRFRDLTEKIRPSEETLKKLSRILRGVVSLFRFVGKVILGIWNTIIKPIFDTLFGASNSIFSLILDVLAQIADAFFGWEKGIDQIEALASIGEILKNILQVILYVVINLVALLKNILSPVIRVITNTIGKLVNKLKDLLSGNGGNVLKNVADGFKNIGDRAKKAWTSTESLADVFNRFKGGSGIGNFLKMLGAMLDNIVTRVGRVIAAFFGLDEEMTKGRVGHAIESLKDVFYEVGIIIRWIYTNVIRPTLFALFEGVAACMNDIGEAFKSGDILHILEVIGKSIKTIGALELFKVLRAIAQIFGSGGLLKVFRNTAKTIKQIGGYFKAQTMNAISSSLLKFAIAAGLVLGVLIAISYLPTDNLETLKSLLLGTAIALGIFLAAVTLMTAFNHGATNVWDFFKADPLESAARMLFGLTAAILTTIGAVFLLKMAFNNLFDDVKDSNGKVVGKELNVGRLFATIAGTLAPVLTIVSALWLIGRVLRKSGIVKHLAAVAAAIVGISASIMLLAVAIRTLTGVFADKDNSAKQIWAAFGMVVLLISIMAIVTVLMSKFLATSGNLKSGFAVAAGVVAMVAATVFIVMPMLEELVQDASKFPQYAAAVGIIVAALLGIGASFFLLTYGAGGKGGSIKILVAGFVFYKITQVIKNFMIPMLQEMAKIDTSTAIGSAVSIGLLVLLIGIAIERMLKGIASIVAELRRINAKTWISIILSMGAVIAAIVVLTHIFEDQGKELSIGSVLLVLGTFAALIIGFGVFAKMITKASNGDYNTMMGIVSILNSLSIFIGLLTASLVGTMAAIRYMFDGNIGDAFTIMGSMALIILGTLATSMFILMKAVESLGRSFKASRMANIDTLKDLIIATFISIAGLIVILTTSAVVIKLVYKDTLGYLGTIATIVIGALLLLGGVFTALGVFLTKVPNYNVDQDTFKMIVATFVGTFAMVAEITAAAIILHNVFSEGGMLGTVATVVGSAIVLLGGILLALGSFIHQVTTGHQDISNNEIAAISISLLSIIVLIGEVAFGLIPALEKIQNVPVENIAASLLGVSLIIAVILGMAAKIQAVGTVSIKGLVASMIGLAANLLILTFALPRVFEAFNSFREVNIMDIVAGLAAIIVPFYVLTQTISAFAFSGVGSAFIIVAAEVAGGLFLIAGAMAAIAVASSMLKDVFGLGETTFSIFNQGFKKEAGIKSPAREMAKDGKYLAQGLGLGIKQSRRFLTNTSVAMAENFNEDFCDTLGIASPSKVFYENGRFVVRGFINGLGDETNKNKQAGADMADGFTSGMDDAIEKMKSEFGGIWDGLDINDEAEKAGEGLFDSFFNKFLGDDGEVLTEEEQKKYDELVKERDKMMDAWNRQNATLQQTNPEEFAKKQAAYKDEITKTSDKLKGLAELETKIANKSASGGGFASTLSSIFNGSLTDAFSNPELKARIDGGLSDIGGKITGFFGIDSDFTKQIKDIFTGNNGVVNDVIGAGAEKVKELLPDEVTEAINDLTENGGIETAASNLGDKIGSGIMMGISNALAGWWLPDLLDFFSGKGRQKQINAGNQDLITSFDAYLEKQNVNEKYRSNFSNLLKLALVNNDNIALSMQDIANIFSDYIRKINEGKEVTSIELSQGLEDYANAFLSSSYVHYVGEEEDARNEILMPELEETFKNILKSYYNDTKEGMFTFESDQPNFTDEQMIDEFNKYKGTILAKLKSYGTLIDDDGHILFDAINGSSEDFQEFYNYVINRDYIDEVQAQETKDKVNAINTQIGALLTKDGYQLTEKLTKEQIEDLKTKFGNAFDSNGYLAYDISSNNDMVSSILSYLRDISVGGIKVKDENDTTTYDRAQEIYYGLQNAYASGSTEEIMKWSNAKNVYRDEIKEAYDSLIKFMGSKEYADLSKDQKLHWLSQKDFYETYFGDIVGSKKVQEYTREIDNTITSATNKLSKDKDKKFLNVGNTTPEQQAALERIKEREAEEAKKAEELEKELDEARKRGAEALEKATFDIATRNIREDWTKTHGKYSTLSDEDMSVFKGFMDSTNLKYDVEDIFRLFQLGMDEGWLSIDKDGKLKAAQVTYDIIQTIRQALGIKSPSTEAITIMDYFMQGLNVGIDKNIASVLDSLTDATDLMTDTTKLGLQAMVDSLDDDTIQPTITPIFDDNAIQNGVTGVNTALNNFVPTTQATVNSFKSDTPNYNGSFASLNNQVAMLTGVVNSFMQMVADGDLININVNAEADPNNIYELVVNANRQKFKQTGKNPLSY